MSRTELSTYTQVQPLPLQLPSHVSLPPPSPPSPLLPFPLADVVESPDFGLIVLALCAPRIARAPFDFSSSDDGPHLVLALLPLPLLVAQWGLLLTVFYQSIKDCTTLHIS